MRISQTLLIAGLSALWALQRLPHDYYGIIRWLVFAGAGYGAYGFARRQISIAAIACSIVSILFNPIVPIRLHRFQWQPIDLLGGICLLALAAFAFTLERTVSPPEA
jgi:MFS-type transporter involved in bile tolerance (Atg22 family)